ncbi:sulfatase-like hydrolase/transferase [Anaerobacillus sp. HL2]|nr:sulfatase-like hydrolase/transferase [Anaerobacillus sp. HL2]
MYFLPQGSIPYSQYIHQPIPTLASILRAQGYESVALHNYHNWFYRRDQVYENFGFDRFC